jgi:hypothetical protein
MNRNLAGYPGETPLHRHPTRLEKEFSNINRARQVRRAPDDC